MTMGSLAAPRAGTEGGAPEPWLVIGEHSFRSRLVLGIEQYTSPELVGAVLEAGGCDVFITTFDLTNTRPSLLLSDLDQVVDLDRFTWIGTTSFARTKDEALRTVRALRDSFGIEIMKLDVRPADNLPHNAQTVTAARELVADGFAVLPFIRPDVDTALELQDIGCSALRVQTSPVASHRGIDDPDAVRAVIEAVDVPVVIEGGLGSPAHVVAAMELGATAVLVNTAVAVAASPERMATAMRHAVLAGQYGVGQVTRPRE
jgi:thiazole synthase